jgi:hypothetical protein
MQDTTDYSPEAVAELLAQVKPLVNEATEIGRAVLIEHGDPRFATDYPKAKIRTMSEMHVSPMIDRIKFADGGPHEVPQAISSTAHLIHKAYKLRQDADEVRIYQEEGNLSGQRLEWYQGAVRALAASLAATRKALAERAA